MITQIWYWKGECSRDLLMGFDWCKEKGKLPDPTNLAKTHVMLKEMNETNPEIIFGAMQGEVWSPMGEQNGLIREKGLDHTSMSVGDVLVINQGGVNKTLMADMVGFKEIKQEDIPKKFATAAEVRKACKDAGFLKVKVRWGNNPFGGEGKFWVKLTDLPEGITLIHSSGSKTPAKTFGDEKAEASGVLGKIEDLRKLFAKTNVGVDH